MLVVICNVNVIRYLRIAENFGGVWSRSVVNGRSSVDNMILADIL